MERARHFVGAQRHRKLRNLLGVPRAVEVDLTTLEVLASLKAYLTEPIDTIVDVGAHKAGFSRPAFYALEARKILAFEPNSELTKGLISSLSDLPAEVRATAIGEHVGVLELQVHDDPSMSSLLHVDQDVLRREFNTYNTSNVRTVKVQASTLDVELSNYTIQSGKFFLKLDTQGNELAVLRGASTSLARCCGILTEYMFLTPYLGQESFFELVSFLHKYGFECKAILDFRRKPSHRVSSVDFLFLPYKTGGS